MKRLVMVMAVMVVLVPATVWAQDVPKAEVFGGFSVLTLKESSGPRLTPIGWQASITANVNEMFGIVGDFGGEYKDDATNCPSCKFHSFLGGVRIAKRLEKATVFGHALYGGTKISGTGFGETDFTMGYGGGIDVNATDKIAIRIIQFDWLPTRVDSSGTSGGKEWLNNIMRFGFGIVFKSGSK